MPRNRIDWADLLLRFAVISGFIGVGTGFVSDLAFYIFCGAALLCCVTALGLVINRKDN